MEPTKNNGALIGSIIVIVILVLGGIYLFTQKAPEPKVEVQNNEQSIRESNEAMVLESELDLMYQDLETEEEVDLNADLNTVQ